MGLNKEFRVGILLEQDGYKKLIVPKEKSL